MEENNILNKMLEHVLIQEMISRLPDDQKALAQDYIEKVLRPTYSRVVSGLKSERAQIDKDNI